LRLIVEEEGDAESEGESMEAERSKDRLGVAGRESVLEDGSFSLTKVEEGDRSSGSSKSYSSSSSSVSPLEVRDDMEVMDDDGGSLGVTTIDGCVESGNNTGVSSASLTDARVGPSSDPPNEDDTNDTGIS